MSLELQAAGKPRFDKALQGPEDRRAPDAGVSASQPSVKFVCRHLPARAPKLGGDQQSLVGDPFTGMLQPIGDGD
jgi:hypothetical protein